MKPSRLPAGLCAAAALALAGCVGLRLRPAAPLLPQAADAPISLHVGLVADNPAPPLDFSGSDAPRAASPADADFGALFADALRKARLFTDVRYPMPRSLEALQKTDIILNASFKSRFQGDPGKSRKAALTKLLLFLPSSFIEYEDLYGASGRVTVDDRDGNGIREYSESVELAASWKIFSETRSRREGPAAAARALVARLTAAMAADRPLFAKIANEQSAWPGEKPQPEAYAVPAPPEAARVETSSPAPKEEPAGPRNPLPPSKGRPRP